jgi:hypothetical protein
LEIALRIVQLHNNDSLQRSYSSQAAILRDWGRLEEAFELLKKEERIYPKAAQQGRLTK